MEIKGDFCGILFVGLPRRLVFLTISNQRRCTMYRW
uniref:Uncharacterized protein n=1 Tax=Anguilla anguilla TaxID=7936 RepID=A0A0E9PZ48_ANGAN